MGIWNNLIRTTAEAAQRLYIEQCNKAYNKVASGAYSLDNAVRDAIDTVAKDRLVIKYPSGHRDTIETAITRAVRTGVGQACGQISERCMEDKDWDIILVSAHLGARYGDEGENPTNHAWWQGKFYSRTGRTENLPNFIECTGYGTGEGLCGWNCRHSFGPGDGVNNPWKMIDSEENKKRYDLTQQQRSRERAIRRLKREIEVKKAADEDTKAQRKQLAAMNKEYKEFCEKNGLKEYAERLRIGTTKQQLAVNRISLRNIFNNKNSRSSVELNEAAQKLSNIADRYITTESKWSGKLVVNNLLKVNSKITGRKAWNCNIEVINTASDGDILHELLHAHSISQYDKTVIREIYAQHRNIEEASTEYMTRQICKAEGLTAGKAYGRLVADLKVLFKYSGNQSEIDFAQTLFNQPLDSRYNWLSNQVQRFLSDKQIKRTEFERINNAFERLKNG